MASEHIARGYDEELRKLNNTVAEMGGLAENQLGTAIEAVMARDTELAARVVEGDVKEGDDISIVPAIAGGY